MPSYTETFPCPVCCGTTTSTTSPPSVCPEGYEPCDGENLWNWVIQPPDCYWEELISCSEGCDSYQPSFTPLCEAGQEIAASGLCCKPIGTTTSTTQSPTTTTQNPLDTCLWICSCDFDACFWDLLDTCTTGNCSSPAVVFGKICNGLSSGDVDYTNCY